MHSDRLVGLDRAKMMGRSLFLPMEAITFSVKAPAIAAAPAGKQFHFTVRS